MVDPDGPDDSIIRRRRFACWITQAKNTHLLVFFVGGGGRFTDRASQRIYLSI